MEHYLDNAATTRVSDAAAQAALAAMTGQYGNPSSRHAMGARAAEALGAHRAVIAGALGAAPDRLIFTSGGTEGDNWSVRAALQCNRRVGKHIVTTAVEHDAVLQTCLALEREGYEVTRLAPDRNGAVTAEQVLDAVREDTALVSMMLVNNEVGTILPVAEVSRMLKVRASRALLHCDAVQGFLKIPFTADALGADFIVLSGHKVHAPKGVGAVCVRGGLRLSPLLTGGGQEGGLRSGTEATAQIAAFAAAVEEGQASFAHDRAQMERLRQYTLEQLTAKVPGVERIGAGAAPHILAVTLPGYKSEVLVRFLSDRGIYVSSGSACHKGKPSHVFAALGLDKKRRDGALRVSFCAQNTKADADALCDALSAAQKELFPSLS